MKMVKSECSQCPFFKPCSDKRSDYPDLDFGDYCPLEGLVEDMIVWHARKLWRKKMLKELEG